MPSDFEKSLLALAQNQAKQSASSDPFGQVLGSEEPQSLFDLAQAISKALPQSPADERLVAQRVADVMGSERPRPLNRAANLEQLWETPRGTLPEEGGGEFRAGDEDLAGLFMNGEAQAQADLTGETVVPITQNSWTSPSDDFDIQFDTGDLEVPMMAPNERARFRVDRPPPRVPFQARIPDRDSGLDGRVVMSRQGNGNWRAPTESASQRQVPVRTQQANQPVADRSGIPTAYDRIASDHDFFDD
jgi:hypothetical protein